MSLAGVSTLCIFLSLSKRRDLIDVLHLFHLQQWDVIDYVDPYTLPSWHGRDLGPPPSQTTPHVP